MTDKLEKRYRNQYKSWDREQDPKLKEAKLADLQGLEGELRKRYYNALAKNCTPAEFAKNYPPDKLAAMSFQKLRKRARAMA